MFDFGFWELMLVMIVALLVVGPQRLPGLARQAGLWIGKAKRFVNSVRSDIEREIEAEELKKALNQQQSEIEELKGLLADTQAEVKSELEQTDHLVSALEEELESKPSTQASSEPTSLNQTEPSAPTAEHDARQSSGS